MPPPSPLGQLIDIGGYRLHAQIVGQGGPLVVMDTGLGASGLLWQAVVAEVQSFARVCAIDRAGFAWSDPAPASVPRTSEQFALELHTLLARAQLPPPYIFVGHSLGGVNSLVFNQQYPGEIVGLVLIDSSHPEQGQRQRGIPATSVLRQSLKLLETLARWGWLRPFVPALNRAAFGDWRKVPPAAWDALCYFMAQPMFYAAAVREAEQLETSFAQAQVRPGLLGALPLAVVTAGYWAEGKPAPMKQDWLMLQKELAALSTRSTHTIAQHCNHGSITLARTDAVVAAIKEVISKQ